jgi:hypothetical protein
LGSASTYTGPTQISAGTVNAYTSTPLGMNSDVTVAAGATVFAYLPEGDGQALRTAGAHAVFADMAHLPALLA